MARKRNLTEEVVESLLGDIAKGKLTPGDQLPPEPELAERCGVSRPTVRQALKSLQGAGLLSSRPRRGTTLRASSPETLAPWFAAHLSLADVPASAVAEARAVLEQSIAALAVVRRTEEDLDELRAALQEEKAADGDIVAHTQADLRFHAAILTAAHNPALSALRALLSTYFDRLPEQKPKLAEAEVDRVYEEHSALLAAIEQADTDNVSDLMRQHLAMIL